MRKMTVDYTLPKNIPLLFKKRAQEFGNLYSQASKDENGVFQKYTYSEVYEKIICFTSALKTLGIGKGSNVAIISDNRKEWLITDFAIQSLGGADVPRGCDSMGNEIRFIIDFADCEVAFFENYAQIEKVTCEMKEVPNLKKVVSFETLDETQIAAVKAFGLEVFNFNQLMAKGIEIAKADWEKTKADYEAALQTIDADDVCTMIFTSGTTGTPKGVMLTHRNFMSQLSVVHNYMPGKDGEWFLSILPIWHSFERLAMYVAILLKNGIAYSKPNARVLLADMKEIQPRLMPGVPRLWEALATGVEKTMQKKGGVTYKLYKFFMKVGKAYANYRDEVTGNITRERKINKVARFFHGLIPFILLWPLRGLGDFLVFRKIRAKFGKRFVFAVSGGGALQKETDDFFRAINLKMVEGYGLTETAPAIAFRNYRRPQTGCVGTVFPTIEMKIVKEEDGQVAGTEPLAEGQRGLILIRGPHVMKGYYKRPDLTEKVIDKDGWLNTGDVGLVTFDGFLKITGRAKDTIVLLDGENIEPVGIENALCASEFIESAIVLGQDQKYLASLIVPCKEAIEKWAKNNNIIYDTYEALVNNPQIKKLIEKIVNDTISLKKGFRTCEKIFKIALLSESFKVGRELSAKLEMKRFKIAEMYASLIATLF